MVSSYATETLAVLSLLAGSRTLALRGGGLLALAYSECQGVYPDKDD